MPVGNADGGQWTDGGGGGGSDSFSGDDGNDRLAMSKVPQALEILKPFLKPLLKPKPGLQKIPEFLSKRPGIGKIIGRLDDLTPTERRFAEELRDLGHEVEIVARGAVRTADFRINGVVHELKIARYIHSPTSDGISKAVSKTILRGRGQSSNIIVDAREQLGMTKEIAQRSIGRAFGKDAKRGLASVTVLTKDGPVYVVRSTLK